MYVCKNKAIQMHYYMKNVCLALKSVQNFHTVFIVQIKTKSQCVLIGLRDEELVLSILTYVALTCTGQMC